MGEGCTIDQENMNRGTRNPMVSRDAPKTKGPRDIKGHFDPPDLPCSTPLQVEQDRQHALREREV